MLKKEKRFLFILVVVLFIITVSVIWAMSMDQIKLWIFSLLPPAMIVFYIADQKDNRRMAVKEAVYSCIEESELDAIHNIEFLREYFADIDDLSRFLSLVDSRVISYVFDKDNINLQFKDYITGGIKCLFYFKAYRGEYSLKLDKVSAEPCEKTGVLLCTLYRIALELESQVNDLKIVVKQSRNRVCIKAGTGESSCSDTHFSDKMFTLFSSRNLMLTSA